MSLDFRKGVVLRVETKYRLKQHFSATFCPPHIPDGMSSKQTQVSAARGWRLTA
jgi:hypothetical protein